MCAVVAINLRFYLDLPITVNDTVRIKTNPKVIWEEPHRYPSQQRMDLSVA